MKTKDIHLWRPSQWDEFIGAVNKPHVTRLQKCAIRRRLPSPLLLIGPYGCSKTTLARHAINAFCCERPSASGDPCHSCFECKTQGPDYNGMGREYVHWELDSSQYVDLADIVAIVRSIRAEPSPVAVFWDEFQELKPRGGAGALRKAIEDVKGLWIISTTDEHVQSFDPHLFERLDKVWLSIPTADELVAFFRTKSNEWDIKASDDILRLMVTTTNRSFRTCLKIMAAAAQELDHKLDREILELSLDLE